MMTTSREAFRETVFKRDNYKCVVCGQPAVDAHHILERRLFDDGGYDPNNGASVCGPCHIKCERTEITVEDLRLLCNIQHPYLPEDLYSDHVYDKWGNVVLEDGRRTKGPLFFDESVQKVLKDSLHLFTPYVKYPRTYHLPWSPGITDDDRVLKDTSHLNGRRVIVTEKFDGENTSLYTDYYHARSITSRHHSSQAWAKNFHSQMAHDIPEGWRVCCENVYAKHSIEYDQLESYVYGFSVWNERNECLSWDDTLEWFTLLNIVPVTVLYDGIFDEKAIKALYTEKDWGTREGYVLRVADSFTYGDFRRSVAKFVRRDHVRTVTHWRYGQAVVPNKLL